MSFRRGSGRGPITPPGNLAHARAAASFTAAVPMRRNDEPMFEYACHEGNYGLLNILRGARAQEAEEQ